MEFLESLVGVALSVVAIGIAVFYLYATSSHNNTVMDGSATSAQVCEEKYDVFISFRGLDVRRTFLSHLTKQLRQKGIDVYVDERLKRGDEISTALLEAIQGSKIALVIFSEDYASSRWCLEELVKIMECKRVNNQIVIPVFYNVDPSHVRHQQGSYADAFSQHKLKFKGQMLQLWRSVLKEAANLSGYHYSSNFNNESDLIDGVIKELSKKLEDKDTVEPNHLIGFDEILAAMESFMNVDSQGVGVLGIWGKGGIGKTTLAHAVFDKFCRQFDSSCFASNVREESKKIGLTCLLEKILSVLLNDKNLAMSGRANIQRRLRRARVLLVLDDVDTSSQVQYLLEENLPLGPSSKVIITSRDKQVLVSGGVHVVHEVKELNMQESLQLFYWYAFKQAYPKMGYEKLSTLAIQYTRGLPLALKVLGSSLYCKDTKAWESALKKLKKYPNAEIQSVLKVSYDGLDIPEKKIFLDIAFFFKGEKKKDVMRVLDACDDFYVDCGIDSLLNKALITISKDNRVEIHDLLQEMAEEIVREESREHPERRSRLNEAGEIQDVLANNKGTGAIEGIILNTKEFENDLYLSADAFKDMSNLRFLKIDHVYLPNGLNSLSNRLRYFCWKNYPLESLPSGFCAEKLVEINMRFSKVTKLWDGVQDLVNLKIIDLCMCQELKELPDLSMARNLEIVNLKFCQDLCCIHPSILSLPKLASVYLSSCRNLENLHEEKHLKSLKHLVLAGCKSLKEFLVSSEEMTSLNLEETGIEILKLPVGRFNKLQQLYLGLPLKSFQINELSCLASLKIFSLSHFGQEIDKSKLVILFDAWRCLEELRLEYCVVHEIPDNISGMSSLKILSLRGCYVETLPNSMNHLSELKEIDLGECKRLRSLYVHPPSITRFYADECTSLAIINFTVMRAIYNNSCDEVKVCYPESTIPKGFKYSHMAGSSITIELALTSSSDHLLGFVSCCILSPLNFRGYEASICRKFHIEDEEINYKDEKAFPGLGKLNTDHAFVWYDPMERILKGSQRRRYEEGTTYKFACEFFIGNFFHSRVARYDHLIKGCGIWPIYASELRNTVQQLELNLHKVTETEMPLESVTSNTETGMPESVTSSTEIEMPNDNPPK